MCLPLFEMQRNNQHSSLQFKRVFNIQISAFLAKFPHDCSQKEHSTFVTSKAKQAQCITVDGNRWN